MINKLIWNKVEELFYWNISVDSPINQLPFTMDFILTCQKEFSMKVRLLKSECAKVIIPPRLLPENLSCREMVT